MSQLLKDLPRDSLEQLVANLPKVDLHCHLEGAIAPESMLPYITKHGIDLPTDLAELRSLTQITPETRSLVDFLTRFHHIGKLFQSCAIVTDLTRQVVLDAAEKNVKHLELRFSPSYIALSAQLDQQAVVDAVAQGVKEAQQQTGISVSLIAIIERQMDLATAWEVARLAVANKKIITALDLANDEYNYPPEPFAEIFQYAKKAGLKITVHAGEAAGPENIRTAIEQLGADRIGHGVRLYQDPELEQELIKSHIPLELCFTSNLQTQAVSDSAPYPLRRYLDLGLNVTLNTDDPGISGIDLNHEFLLAIDRCNLTEGDLAQLSYNAIDAAFCDLTVKEQIRAQISDYFAVNFAR